MNRYRLIMEWNWRWTVDLPISCHSMDMQWIICIHINIIQFPPVCGLGSKTWCKMYQLEGNFIQVTLLTWSRAITTFMGGLCTTTVLIVVVGGARCMPSSWSVALGWYSIVVWCCVLLGEWGPLSSLKSIIGDVLVATVPDSPDIAMQPD